ncbi:LytR/AlgR family response regulator transcription factor [Pseudoalteromonas luteoviolacea]|uniref:Response regulatory domain-containing protein n=1 Tax=Pseudoalteromonas luteoviolacea S4054 TaxID=1129367 RepID=A0A0F6ACN8_9GAMM|nr:LytTR family DNA-binding domain-containing protein [Pseudoalteromonas luteoviolacea]AOT10371.1 two-component system response regulator [Pseudoalteromonas luteoviolacea]AOT15560.1 two-component system response regulator [Pseudoalteromonas luteoviolacea]AOT20189.1 two-component system response regulator [Pseudoalteromonas luteoviolacea]KKE83174.1 hypothetical protein N479_15445 [Pseudoalteromonas luteoviolacea S4054]KZN66698.1 hypothetical protein N481_24175 [Pseudoalteromonas luteoviolacea S
MLTAVVIEDSRLARNGLMRLLEPYTEIDVIGSADCVANALELVKSFRPEVLFLDIHMPGESGFDLLEQLDYSPKVIFTTAYNEHALRSFDYNVVDYLLKPINKSRLCDAITKLTASDVETPSETFQEPEIATMTMQSKVFIKDGGQCYLLPIKEIDYFESCKNYTRVFFSNKNAYIKKPLNSVLKRLPESDFFQANRQQIINLNSVTNTDLGVGDTCEVTLNHCTSISVSRRNLQIMKAKLGF